MLLTDYLVIGAGAASMAFVDTLLSEQPHASVIIVDKHDAPGGHWNDAYGFVQLHQPSLLYGVSSVQMEGNWGKLLLKGTLPWTHRASKQEILSYYRTLMKNWVDSGRVSYYPKCQFHFGDKQHSFSTLNGNETYQVIVRVKLVNGILGECRVPSQTPPSFSVNESVTLWTPNQVYEHFNANSTFRQRLFSSNCTNNSKKFVVLGAGKTAMDTIVYLQQHGVDPSIDISWVIPNDVWILRREGPGTPWSWGEALLGHNLDINAAALALEKKGVFDRVDTTVLPTKFRFPVVGKDEMKFLRNVKNVIRHGRVTSIAKGGQVSFTDGESLVFGDNHIFCHCTSPGPFNGNTITTPFPNNKEINLCLLYAPPVPISMSSIAILESRRRNGTLNLEFGRKLLQTLNGNRAECSETAVLQTFIGAFNIAAKDDATLNGADQIVPLKTLALFTALLDEDPMVAYKWLSSNRLSFFSIPGFKGKVYETVLSMKEKQTMLHLSKQEVEVLSLVADNLKPLAGK